MKILHLFINNKAKILPPLAVVAILFTAGTIAYAFSPHSPLVEKQSETPSKEVSYKVKETQAPIPSPQITSSPQTTVLGTQTHAISPTPTIVKASTKQESPTTTTQTNTSSTTTQTPIESGQTPAPAQATQPVQAASQTVSVEIKAPDTSSTFSVEVHDGMNVCDVLQKAKEDGKISSVTMDDSYMATLHSKYVAEINGFSNNWTFSVNGASPLGCSLAQPKPNDSIVWKFG